MRKKWQLAKIASQEIKNSFPELPETILQLLFNRGIATQKKIDEFLNPDYSKDINDPYLFKDMEKAVARIYMAIDNDELIIVHGDYDADGVCASVILMSVLKNLGAKHLDIFLPDRDLDGYGINKNTVEIIAAAGAKLLISCDCGISNKEETELAQNKGIDVIITDHHSAPETLPKVCAIIHPKVPRENYPDKNLSGGGVAFKLMQALIKSPLARNHWQNKNIKLEAFEKWQLDLAAISSVADMIPLIGESRALTKYGLIVLNKTKRPGLKELIDIGGLNKNSSDKNAPLNLNARHIAFQLAPRINAAGRMKHANTAFQLLITEDKDEAKELAIELNANNKERQQITEKMTNEAIACIEETKQENNPIIFVMKENWPVGLIGLIASKLNNLYYKPVLVMTKKDEATHGSGRSIEEIDIMEKLVKLKKYFLKYGGHPRACGFTLKQTDEIFLNNFQKDMLELVKEDIKNKDITPLLTIDAEVILENVNWDLFDVLQKFEPFGENNPEPKFLASNITIANIEAVGNNGRHLKLLATQGGFKHYKFIGFCFGDEKVVGQNWRQVLKPRDTVDIIFEIGVNEWNGNRELQLKIVDLKKI